MLMLGIGVEVLSLYYSQGAGSRASEENVFVGGLNFTLDGLTFIISM